MTVSAAVIARTAAWRCRFWPALCVLANLGCERAVQYALARNGGMGPTRATCDVHAIVLSQPVRFESRNAPGCAEGRAWTTSQGATFVYWQASGAAELSGPVASNEVTVQLLGPELMDADPSAMEPNARGARANAESTARVSTDSAEGASVGAGSGPPPISVRKSASRTAVLAGDEIDFRIEVQLNRNVALQRLVVVDHVDAWLRVTEARGARIERGPQGSTVLIWDTTVVPRSQEENMVVRFTAFARSPNYERTR